MYPGLCLAVGNKARDLLYKDYVQQQPIQLLYQSFNWSFGFSCQIEEILPGLNSVFGVTIPDSGKAELQYFRDYIGFSAGVALKRNPATGLDPVANISCGLGSNLLSLGADLGFDITTRFLSDFSAGLSLDSSFLVASLTLDDSFDSIRASFYRELNLPNRTAVAAELKYGISDSATTVAVGFQHALLPFTLLKGRLNTDGEVSAVLRQLLWQRFSVSVAGEMDLRDSSSNPRIGLSLALNP